MSRREPSDSFPDDGPDVELDAEIAAELAAAFGDERPTVSEPATISETATISEPATATAPVRATIVDESLASEATVDRRTVARSSVATTSDDATGETDDAWGFFRRHLPLDRLRSVRVPRPTLPRPALPRRFRRRTEGTSTVGSTPRRTPVTKDVGGRTRVVITDDTAAPAKVTGQARFRERRIAARRAEGRRRLRLVVIAGSIVAVIVVVLLLLASPLLSIRTVDVEGVVYADPERVGEVVASLRGDAILTADLHGAERALEEIAWVREARVSMHLPRRIAIQIDEREPIAFYRAVDGFNRVIDIDGRVLDVIEGDPVDFPPIQGTGPNLSDGDFVSQPFLGAAQLINALPRDLRLRLVSMAVTPDGEVSFLLTDDVTILFGRPDRFQDKLVALVNEIKRQGGRSYSVIDVSTGQASVR